MNSGKDKENSFIGSLRSKHISKVSSYEFNRAFKQKKYYIVLIVGLIFQIGILAMPKVFPEIEELELFEHSHIAMNSVLFPVGFFTLLVSLAVAFDSISGEFENKSANILFTKPLSKTEFYIGKFLGGFGAIIVSILIWSLVGLSGYVIYGSQTLLSNVPFAIVSLIYAALPFLAIITAVSAITKKSTISVVIVLMVYFVQTIALVPILQYIYGENVTKILPNWGIESFPTAIAGTNSMATGDIYLAALSIAAYSLIPLAAGLIYFKHADISG